MIGQDKIEHWAFGFVLTFFYLVHPTLIYTGIVFGIAKEIYDDIYGNGWSTRDLIATSLGAYTGMLFLGWLI